MSCNIFILSLTINFFLFWDCIFDKDPQEETEETATGSDESLQRSGESCDLSEAAVLSSVAVHCCSFVCFLRALHHLDRLKTLVDDMNERKARAEDDGTDCKHTPAANITNCARIKKQL